MTTSGSGQHPMTASRSGQFQSVLPLDTPVSALGIPIPPLASPTVDPPSLLFRPRRQVIPSSILPHPPPGQFQFCPYKLPKMNSPRMPGDCLSTATLDRITTRRPCTSLARRASLYEPGSRHAVVMPST
ncbi:hypothetical protein MAPG_10737 [Magnaporthiopsis poae ATCC 64411]|uniref:Uncharacterized protein n=1 Tax=Magnaporthiopsis poae (strain ATCC 64411 / 73-15) TaxID=644358 RepID=A0A0C4EDD9_MAGP6|nr:hypothetical protein MAPG_10737 [Magnaporthiopsis poae ATCC 64411]